MLCRKIFSSGSSCLRKLSFVGSHDPDMSKDTLFDDKFEVRKQIYLRPVNPILHFVASRSWKLKQKVTVLLGGKVPEVKSEAEVNDRNELMYRLEEFYLEIPQRMPDQVWFDDLIDHYTEYNDVDGARDIWKWIAAHDIWVDMDQEVMDKFQRFFEKNDPKSLTKLSDHQHQLRLDLHQKFKEMDDNPERWYKKRLISIENPKRSGIPLPPGDRPFSGGGF